jgi:hypothetical protein
MPITGPFTTILGGYDDGFTYVKAWMRQSKPYLNPLPYDTYTVKYGKGTPSSYGAAFLVNSYAFDHYSSFFGSLDTKAYDRFYAKVGEKAELLMNAIEFRSSAAMMATRASQLGNSLLALKNGRADQAISHLLPRGKRYDPKLAKRVNLKHSRDGVASAWLELQFGWIPVIQDIYNVCEVFATVFSTEKVIGSASGVFKDSSGGVKPSFEGIARRSVRKTGYIQITNPNVFLANQLGLLNPAVTLWDSVPLSFVADWSLGINKYLRSLSNDFGCTVTRPQTAVKQVASGNALFYDGYGNLTDSKPYEVQTFRRLTTSFSRPGISARAKIPEVSVWKTITSLALVNNLLSK